MAEPQAVEMDTVTSEIPLDDDAPAKGAAEETVQQEEEVAAGGVPLVVQTYSVTTFYTVVLVVHAIILTVLGLVFNRPLTGIITVAALGTSIPWVLVVYWWKRECATNARVAELYGLGFEIGHLVVLSQLTAKYVMEIYLLDLFTKTTNFYLQWAMFLVFVFVITTLVSAVPDELFKFIMTWRVRKEPDFSSRYGCVVLATATSMGFAACSLQADLILSYWGIYKLPGELWLWILERLCPAMIMHLLCGIWLGIGLSKRYFRREGKRPYGYFRILLMPLLIHCLYELFYNTGIVLFAMQRLSSGSWISLTISAVVVLCIGAAWTMKNVAKTLADPHNYDTMQPSLA